jgi:hypothetical protein
VPDYLASYATRLELPVQVDFAVSRREHLGDRFATHTRARSEHGRLS